MSRTVPVRTARTQSTAAQQPTSDEPYRIDFGSHRGLTLAEAPASWVRWVLLHEVYAGRPALRAALEQGGWMRPGQPAPDVRYGSVQDDGRGGGGAGGGGSSGSGRKDGQGGAGWTAFCGGGNVLGGTPASR